MILSYDVPEIGKKWEFVVYNIHLDNVEMVFFPHKLKEISFRNHKQEISKVPFCFHSHFAIYFQPVQMRTTIFTGSHRHMYHPSRQKRPGHLGYLVNFTGINTSHLQTFQTYENQCWKSGQTAERRPETENSYRQSSGQKS